MIQTQGNIQKTRACSPLNTGIGINTYIKRFVNYGHGYSYWRIKLLLDKCKLKIFCNNFTNPLFEPHTIIKIKQLMRYII